MENVNIKEEASVEFVLILPARNQAEKIKVKQENVEEANDEFVRKVCEKKFKKKWNLNQHQRNHEIRTKCLICSNIFAQRNMKQHVRNHNKSFECTNCKRKFAEKRYLKSSQVDSH
jgi:hypothetical protein